KRVLDEPREHLATDLLAEHALEHRTRHAALTEAADVRLPSDARVGAIELALDLARGHFDLHPLAYGREALDDDALDLHDPSVPKRAGARAGPPHVREGGLDPPRVVPARS